VIRIHEGDVLTFFIRQNKAKPHKVKIFYLPNGMGEVFVNGVAVKKALIEKAVSFALEVVEKYSKALNK
jgi:hypothetical protein